MTDPINVRRVVVPNDLYPSIVNGASGEPYVVQTAPTGERFIMALEDDPRTLLNGGYSDQRWKQANATLSGRPPKPKAGINLAALQMAHYQATRPVTITEDLARLRSALREDGDEPCRASWRDWHHGADIQNRAGAPFGRCEQTPRARRAPEVL